VKTHLFRIAFKFYFLLFPDICTFLYAEVFIRTSARLRFWSFTRGAFHFKITMH